MNFNEYIKQVWTDHAENAEKVSATIDQGILLLSENEPKQISQLVQFITHVFGEHLNQFDIGLTYLKRIKETEILLKLKPQDKSEEEKSILRAEIILQIAADESKTTLLENSNPSFSNSDKVRIFIGAANIFNAQGNTLKADFFLRNAVNLSSFITNVDPANRALAIAGNNIASILEEKMSRSLFETNLMIFAAQVGRKFWEVAGTWLEIERAEYRLSQSYRSARMIEKSLTHAQNCVEICSDNSADAMEMFFAYECLTLAEQARKNDIAFNKALELMKLSLEKIASPEDKSWCEDILKKIMKQ